MSEYKDRDIEIGLQKDLDKKEDLVVFDDRNLFSEDDFIVNQGDIYNRETEELYIAIGCTTFPHSIFLMNIEEEVRELNGDEVDG